MGSTVVGMVTFTKRELNQRTSDVLAAAQTDGPIIVTERGVPRWRIEAMQGPSAPVDRLRADGRVIEAKTSPAPWDSSDGSRSATEIDALLDELRTDDRL